MSTNIILYGNIGTGNGTDANNTTNTTINDTINPDAIPGDGEVLLDAAFDPSTPNAISGKDLIINANIKNLIDEETEYILTVSGYEDYAELLVIYPQIIQLEYNEEKDSVIHLYMNNNVEGYKTLNIRVYYNDDSYEEIPLEFYVSDNRENHLKDIAYIVKNTYTPDNNFISVMDELGYDYELIAGSKVPSTNFSKYNMILLGDESISNVPVNNFKSLFANPDYYTGWSSSKASTSKPTAYISNKNISITDGIPINFNAYTNTQTTLYYLTKSKYGCKSIATTGNSSVDLGHFLVAYKENPRRIFFGITKSNYWSSESRDLFKNSIYWVIEGEDNDDDGYFSNTDCNDNNAEVYRNVKAYLDNDDDGYGAGNYLDVCTGDSLISGYSYINGDCNNYNPNVNPDMDDIPYNGVDDDCNGYDIADVDMDGYCKQGYFVQNTFIQCINDLIGIGSDCKDDDETYNIGSGDIYKNCKNDAPQVDNIMKIIAYEDEVVAIDVIAEDPENNTLVYTINDTRFTNDDDVFTWTTGFNDEGTYVFRIVVSDGNLSNSTDAYVEIKKH